MGLCSHILMQQAYSYSTPHRAQRASSARAMPKTFERGVYLRCELESLFGQFVKSDISSMANNQIPHAFGTSVSRLSPLPVSPHAFSTLALLPAKEAQSKH